ncbi:SIS domain-containing protein [Humidesulfovibrio idahonensis]
MIEPIEWLKSLGDICCKTKSKVCGAAADLPAAYVAIGDLFRATRERGGTVWWVGNGGSCAICSHLSQDVMNKLCMRSQVLSDPSLMTCMANDFGYAEIYARPLARLARAGDLLIAISSSGNSANILACADFAVAQGLRLVTLSAFSDTNLLWNHAADVSFYLPSSLYGIAEVGHEALLHAAIECQFLAEKG